MTTTTIAARARGRAQRRRRIVARDGTSLSVTEWSGPSTRRTVVFLHGLCLSHGAWSIQVRHVLRRFGADTRVIAYDHRGHGDSGPAAMNTYRIGQLAEDLDDVLDTLDVSGPLVLVGHSMGAMAALTYLSEGSRAAEVAGLVLVATAAGGLAAQGVGRLLHSPALDPLTGLCARLPARAGRVLTAPVRVVLEQVCALGGARSGALAAVVANALATTPLSTAVGFLASLRDFDATPHLDRITAHTTILSGGVDRLTPPSLSREMAAAIPGAGHVHIPTAGHMLPQHESPAVNAAVTAAVEAAGLARTGSGALARSA